ncbi:YegS/Rv2252/BmrU family lipid kinase [Flavobacteriaceae bacterium]|nr:YegS/Rv2252/BmrU family lipid kinase [Flavobacteriaceae bacterium]MDC0570455.1 YegS/Rv2252/BmrU family lipid kinase [Flavobacteriaceae bacterium]
MGTKTSIHFIVNPISGKGKNKLDSQVISSVLNNNDFHVVIKTTKYANNAAALTKTSILEGANAIIACGGDGTVNEVASQLVDSPILLGIIRLGSGNGLASHLGISPSINEALEVIKQYNNTKIDVGTVNEHFFFSNMSLGIGARIINHYTGFKKRQIVSYLRASFKALLYKSPSQIVDLEIDNFKKTLDPLVLFVSNSNEMGYNLSFTPKASLQDGKLDVVFTEQLSFVEKILFASQLIFNKHKRYNKANYFLTDNIKVTNKKQKEFLTQLDGESIIIKSKELNISIKKGALNVLVPKS